MWRAHFLNAIKSIVACDDILENIDGRISCATDHGIWHIYIYRPKYEVYVYIYICVHLQYPASTLGWSIHGQSERMNLADLLGENSFVVALR